MIDGEEDLDYLGHVLQVRRLGGGWVARIRRADGVILPRSPLSIDLARREAVIKEAMRRIGKAAIDEIPSAGGDAPLTEA
ncbi:MAG: hypothetical protein CFE29_01395 [Bradyrhizobiaceae bacterium PARB1]|jgi:hypothetical protein|nr:MAG: hypothetical protein CFE29_01395 [Bradyrhizobiaceae bacterium PARB1]